MQIGIGNGEPRPIAPRRSWREWRDDPRRGSIKVEPKDKSPRPRATPVPEVDRNWRPATYIF